MANAIEMKSTMENTLKIDWGKGNISLTVNTYFAKATLTDIKKIFKMAQQYCTNGQKEQLINDLETAKKNWEVKFEEIKEESVVYIEWAAWKKFYPTNQKKYEKLMTKFDKVIAIVQGQNWIEENKIEEADLNDYAVTVEAQEVAVETEIEQADHATEETKYYYRTKNGNVIEAKNGENKGNVEKFIHYFADIAGLKLSALIENGTDYGYSAEEVTAAYNKYFGITEEANINDYAVTVEAQEVAVEAEIEQAAKVETTTNNPEPDPFERLKDTADKRFIFEMKLYHYTETIHKSKRYFRTIQEVIEEADKLKLYIGSDRAFVHIIDKLSNKAIGYFSISTSPFYGRGSEGFFGFNREDLTREEFVELYSRDYIEPFIDDYIVTEYSQIIAILAEEKLAADNNQTQKANTIEGRIKRTPREQELLNQIATGHFEKGIFANGTKEQKAAEAKIETAQKELQEIKKHLIKKLRSFGITDNSIEKQNIQAHLNLIDCNVIERYAEVGDHDAKNIIEDAKNGGMSITQYRKLYRKGEKSYLPHLQDLIMEALDDNLVLTAKFIIKKTLPVIQNYNAAEQEIVINPFNLPAQKRKIIKNPPPAQIFKNINYQNMVT